MSLCSETWKRHRSNIIITVLQKCVYFLLGSFCTVNEVADSRLLLKSIFEELVWMPLYCNGVRLKICKSCSVNLNQFCERSEFYSIMVYTWNVLKQSFQFLYLRIFLYKKMEKKDKELRKKMLMNLSTGKTRKILTDICLFFNMRRF